MGLNKPFLKLAILVVNGRSNYRDRLWIELSIGNLLRRTSPRTDFRIFLWNHDLASSRVTAFLQAHTDRVEVLDGATFDTAGWEGERITHPPSRSQVFAGGCHVHRAALQMLFDTATSRYDVDTVFTFDSDSWPLRDNWDVPLLEQLEHGKRLVGAWRDELQQVIPPYVHPSCLGLRIGTLHELRLRFDREPLPPREDTLSHFSASVANRHGGDSILKLERSNRTQLHGVFNGVYAGMVYHHHLGTRYRDGRNPDLKTYGWQERNETLAQNKTILDDTTRRVFADPDDFCCELNYGPDSARMKQFNLELKRNPGREHQAAFFSRAHEIRDRDPLLAHHILGQIGCTFARDRDFLRLHAAVSERLGRHWEAESFTRLAEST